MWRIALSMALMFGAVGGSALAMIVIFLIVPALWETLFGIDGAAFGALGALALVIWGAGKMMSLADRLGGTREPRHQQVAAAAEDADAPSNWQEYNASIARNKRWAFYRRTQQFERLQALEAEDKAERAKQQAPPSHPHHTLITAPDDEANRGDQRPEP